MIMTIMWDHESDPLHPWIYIVTYLGEGRHGRCANMRQCWVEINEFVDLVSLPIIQQDNDPEGKTCH